MRRSRPPPSALGSAPGAPGTDADGRMRARPAQLDRRRRGPGLRLQVGCPEGRPEAETGWGAVGTRLRKDEMKEQMLPRMIASNREHVQEKPLVIAEARWLHGKEATGASPSARIVTYHGAHTTAEVRAPRSTTWAGHYAVYLE
ncbi:hypothetical protein BV20DRAFT_360315 [Pilatotrama ljubarskyi]|nr:hypothetical protein BV20DRAFT_360315 [Pilatotrama ljubarskyi]